MASPSRRRTLPAIALAAVASFLALPGCRRADSGPADDASSPSKAAVALGPTVPMCTSEPERGCFLPVPRGRQAPQGDAGGAGSTRSPGELGPFLLQAFEVTIREYERCARQERCPPVALARPVPDDDLAPASGLSWEAARKVCAFLGGRVPTAAEWVFAARGDERRPYPWGATPPRCPSASMADGCGRGAPTRTYDPMTNGPFGHTSLAGSVWEWVDTPCSEGDAGGVEQRGGGWASERPEELLIDRRACVDPALVLPDAGVRCAATMGASTSPR